MDAQDLQRRVEAAEAAASTNRSSERKLSGELDRLAEHLIGETAPEIQSYKRRIQALIVRVDPHHHAPAEVEMYVETYCRVR